MTHYDKTDIKNCGENWKEEGEKNDEDEIYASNDTNEEMHVTHVISDEEEIDTTHVSHEEVIIDSAGKQSSAENSNQDVLESKATIREVEISFLEVIIGADESNLEISRDLVEENNRCEITRDGLQKENVTHYHEQEILESRCIKKEDCEDSKVIANIMVDLWKGKGAAENGADKIVQNKGVIQVEMKNSLKDLVIGADGKSFEKRHVLKEGKNRDENDKKARHSEVEIFEYQPPRVHYLLLAALYLEMIETINHKTETEENTSKTEEKKEKVPKKRPSRDSDDENNKKMPRL